MSALTDRGAAVNRHESYYEFDGSDTAVYCRCGFYRICESHEVAEAEYRNHIDVGWVPKVKS